MMWIGIDVGSTYTKYCVMGPGGAGGTPELFRERTPVRQREYFADRIKGLRETYGEIRIVTCGYGRRNPERSGTVTELTALAAGAEYQCPGSRAVLDIGGQDTKLVLQERGKLKGFFINEKCAAGSGLFLGNVLGMLQVRFGEIDLGRPCMPEVKLSSVCAVFAQSEIVELTAAGVPAMAVVHGVVRQILVQAKALLGKAECGEILLSGGLTAIPGIGSCAEKILGRKVLVPENGAYLSAIGCALLAERCEGQET